MTFNADSLLNKREEFQMIVQQCDPDIIAISETKPKNCETPVQAAELGIKGYDLFSNLDNDNVRGVALYVKSILKPLEVEIDGNKAAEAVWARVNLRGRDSLLVGSIYRSPNSSPENNELFNKLFNAASNSGHSHILIMGDCNHPDIDWSNGTTTHSETHPTYHFMEAIRDSFMSQHVLEPTHHRAGQQANTLDLVFSNEENMIQTVHSGAPVGKSHHSMLSFLFRCYKPADSSKRTHPLYDKGDYESIRKKLEEIEWENQLQDKNTEDSWQFIKSKITDCTKQHVPTRTTNQATGKPTKPLWMNGKSMTTLKKKHEAFKRYMRTKEGKDYQEYTKFRNQTKWEVRKAKRDFEKQVAKQAKVNPKAFFQYANSKLKTKSGIADLDRGDGTCTESDKEKAEVLNSFFASVFTQEDLSSLPDFTRHRETTLTSIQITEEQVDKQLKKLKPTKSQGPDGIHPKILCEA